MNKVLTVRLLPVLLLGGLLILDQFIIHSYHSMLQQDFVVINQLTNTIKMQNSRLEVDQQAFQQYDSVMHSAKRQLDKDATLIDRCAVRLSQR